MPYAVRTVNESPRLQDVLNQAVQLGPFPRTGLAVGGKTLIFNTPSATVTFSGSLNAVKTLSEIAEELRDGVSGLAVEIRPATERLPDAAHTFYSYLAFWRDDGSGTAGTVVDAAGTANADFGLNTGADTTWPGPLPPFNVVAVGPGPAPGSLIVVLGEGSEASVDTSVAVTNFPSVQAVNDNGGSLTTDSAQLPASLGPKPAAQSLSIALASDVALAQDAHLTDGTQRSKITDGTTNAAVKAASTAPAATDPALVVALRPDTPQLPLALVGGRLDINLGSFLGATTPTPGQKVAASSIPVVIASDQGGPLALDVHLTDGTQRTKLTDGTTNAAVKAASTAAVAADPAVVVAISPNNLQQGQTTALSSATNALNHLPLARYNTAQPTLTDGQLIVQQCDINGNFRVREGYTDYGSFLPSFSTALEKSRVISAAPADLLEYALEIDSAATTGTYWLWIINNSSLPSDGTAIGSISTLWLPRAISHTNGTRTVVALTQFRLGLRGSAAVLLALSSNASQFTFTLVSTSWVAFSAMYRLV